MGANTIMKALANSSECPNCGGGHKSKPYCEYENGWHCFSCGYHKASDRSFTESTSKRIVIPDQPDAKSNPDEFSTDSLKYLLKFHVTPFAIRESQIKECSDGSLIYPNIVNEELVSYQRRWLSTRQILTYGEKLPTFHENSLSDCLVFVEDFISSIRVNELENTICLWGTKATNRYLFDILKNCKYDKIYVWLDNDCKKEVNSGQVAAQKLYKQIEYVIYSNTRRRCFGDHRMPELYNIATDLDPKYYTTTEIREILQGVVI